MVNASRRHQRKTSRRTNNGNGDDDDNEDTDEYHSPEIGGEEIEEQELSGEDEDEYDGNEMKIDLHANLIEWRLTKTFTLLLHILIQSCLLLHTPQTLHRQREESFQIDHYKMMTSRNTHHIGHL